MHAAPARTPQSTGSRPAAGVRACCAALLVSIGACGGSGGGDGPRAPVSTPAQGARAAGAALTVDSPGTGNPLGLNAALGANGDGFVVWRADDVTRHRLWATRYGAATGSWGTPVLLVESGDGIDADFHLSVDTGGSAVVVWRETTGLVSSARFDAGAGAWAPLQRLGEAERSLSASGNAAGVVHVVGTGGGLMFDPASGTWKPTGGVAQTRTGTGYTYGEWVATGADGGALALFHYARTGVEWLGSNHFDRSTSRWDQLPPDAPEGTVIGELGDSVVFADGGIRSLQAAPSGGDRFLAAWQVWDSPDNTGGDIRIARYASASRTWSMARTVVPSGTEEALAFQRIGSHGGQSLLLWTQNDGSRTALRSLRLDDDGIGCDDVRTIDALVGGGAARADLAIDPQGDAIAVWEQFEGGRADDGSRSNIAFSRFQGATGTWLPAALAEAEPGSATGPRASVNGGQALLGWIQSEGGSNRVKVLLKPLSRLSAP